MAFRLSQYMSGLEYFLADSLKSTIQKHLGQKTVKKIEKRLFVKFGINFTQSIIEFNKLDAILREFFGPGADGIETKFFENLIHLDFQKNKNEGWLRIDDPNLSKIVLASYADEDKENILNALSDKAMIIQEVLRHCKIPQTSGYRKINSMIDDGILMKSGSVSGSDGKKINKYTSLFDNVEIAIAKKKTSVKCLPKKEVSQSSPLLQVMNGL